MFLLLQFMDIFTTHYGITKMGLMESNPRVAALMQVNGLESSILGVLKDNLSRVLLLVLLSNLSIGPILAAVVLGAYSFQFIPIVINNLMLITFGVGMNFNELLPVSALAYLIGGFLTLYYLNRIGELVELNEDLKKRITTHPLARRLIKLD